MLLQAVETKCSALPGEVMEVLSGLEPTHPLVIRGSVISAHRPRHKLILLDAITHRNLSHSAFAPVVITVVDSYS
jgi:hypothetical protein